MGVLILDRLKDYLKITDESQDGILQNIVDATNKQVESYCNRIFDSATLTDEEYDGTDSTELWLKRTPVTALSAVKYGYSPSISTLDASNYKWTDSGRLYSISGIIFEIHVNWWKITYTGGYTGKTMPPDLVWAGCKMAALDYKEADSGRIGLTSKTVGGQVVESYLKELPTEVKHVLNFYRRILT